MDQRPAERHCLSKERFILGHLAKVPGHNIETPYPQQEVHPNPIANARIRRRIPGPHNVITPLFRGIIEKAFELAFSPFCMASSNLKCGQHLLRGLMTD
jgi:hypothetical protein